MQTCKPVLLFSAILFTLTQASRAQKAYPLPPGSAPVSAPATSQPASSAAATAPPQTSTQPAAAGQTVSQTLPAKIDDAKAKKEAERDSERQAKEEAKAKKEEEHKLKKEPYSGPTEIVVLAPTPMLDSTGQQELDPDGKPMFNLPVKQLRDKKGHPVFDAKGKPVFQTAKDLGYDEHGKKVRSAKEKKEKTIPVHIARGTFSVDGVVGKAALNYDIPDLKYIYLYVPGMGVAVVSTAPFAGAKEEKAAFNLNILSVSVGTHKLELASDNTFLGKKPESAYVKIDRSYTMDSMFPVVGYGTLRVAPYVWPGAKEQTILAGTVEPPPLLKGLQPKLLVLPCPKGQVRAIATRAQEGQPAPTSPCVPIPVVKPVSLRQATAAK
jgi:hypothetical protein